MGLGGFIPSTKAFNGLPYNFDKQFDDKFQAQERVTFLKSKGWLARIVPVNVSQGWGRFTEYRVYYHRQ